MELSVIITHFQTPLFLKKCLKSIREATKNISAEIIVADSKSNNDFIENLKKEFPGIKCISFIKNVGYTKLVNEGLKKAKGNFILILNADIVAVEDAVEKMIDYMKQNPLIGILGPQQISFDNQIQPTYFKFYTPLTVLCRRTFFGKTKWGKKILDRFLLKEKNPNTVFNVDWLMGSALMTKKSAMQKVGFLDERFYMYFQDVDWAKRFWQNGYKVIYFPKAKIYHFHQKTSRGKGVINILTNKMTRIHLCDGLKYFLK